MPRRKKLKNVRIGVFGLHRGLSFVKNLKRIKGVTLVAVCEKLDAEIEKAKEFLPEGTLVFKNIDEFLEVEMDAVVLANYFHEHAKYAIKFLEKGVHVLSETTAAPTLGECVELCQAVEKSGCKYMLAANTSWMPGVRELQTLYKKGVAGNAIFGEAEYLHPWETEPTGFNNRDKNAYTHWRKYLPRTYYNMHSLGALMEITGSVPVKVSGKACFTPEFSESMSQPYMGDSSSVTITEMDNGAVFTSTGCSSLGPISKWFRIAGDKGNIETLRFDQCGVRIDPMKWMVEEGDETNGQKVYYPEDARSTGLFTDKEIKYADLPQATKSGHAGHCDFWIALYFIKYLRGEIEPFFNVYRATALSAAAILSWRSVLNGGKEYAIPDFTNKRTRKKFLNDRLSPFPDENGNRGLPASSREYDLFKKYNVE